ncbi:hypothetical protein A9Q83_08765 [Alphaproteobacteria bacterium 46_93_T64]|nr:hypothetical protein A9Q83_08765 [Alphaproteobacteria bacterium 46_93_T64]
MNRSSRIAILCGLLFVTISGLIGLNMYQYGSAKQEAEFGSQVRNYLLENPKIIREVIERLQVQEAREQADQKSKKLSDYRDELENDGYSYVAGNPNGDITIVEFFDYRCGYCKRAYKDLMKTVNEDGNIRLVLKEFPILGEDSILATRAAIAAEKQGKYMEYHSNLMNTRGGLSKGRILQIAADTGLDTDQLLKDIDDEEISIKIQKTYQLANSLNITGTPAFVIGGKLSPGAIPAERMKQLVADARAKKAATVTN